LKAAEFGERPRWLASLSVGESPFQTADAVQFLAERVDGVEGNKLHRSSVFSHLWWWARCSPQPIRGTLYLASIVVLGAAALFERLQLQEPSRHGCVFDATVKMAGGVIGLSAGGLFVQFAIRR